MSSYDYTNSDIGYGILGFFAILGLIIIVLSFVISIIQIIGFWKVFKKAGKGGWESLIPFYKEYVLIEISGLNWWWFLLYLSPIILSFIPGLSLISALVSAFTLFNCYYNISKKFNKGIGFAICLTLFTPICIPILGFSKNNVYNDIPVSNNGVFNSSVPKEDSNNYQYNYNGHQNNSNQQYVNEDIKKNNFCGNCGTKLVENGRFCPNCGKEII